MNSQTKKLDLSSKSELCIKICSVNVALVSCASRYSPGSGFYVYHSFSGNKIIFLLKSESRYWVIFCFGWRPCDKSGKYHKKKQRSSQKHLESLGHFTFCQENNSTSKPFVTKVAEYNWEAGFFYSWVEVLEVLHNGSALTQLPCQKWHCRNDDQESFIPSVLLLFPLELRWTYSLYFTRGAASISPKWHFCLASVYVWQQYLTDNCSLLLMRKFSPQLIKASSKLSSCIILNLMSSLTAVFCLLTHSQRE